MRRIPARRIPDADAFQKPGRVPRFIAPPGPPPTVEQQCQAIAWQIRKCREAVAEVTTDVPFVVQANQWLFAYIADPDFPGLEGCEDVTFVLCLDYPKGGNLLIVQPHEEKEPDE